MAHHNTILSQIVALFPRHEFEALAKEHHVGQKFRSFNRWSQFLAMMVAQLSGRKSLRGDPGPGRRRSCDDGCTGEASGDGGGEKGESVNFLNFSGKSINKGFFEQGSRRV